MDKPLFKLDDRLKLCAKYVRKNAKLVDVGTDHAYLPVWLYKNNKIECALAVDINEEPLKRGIKTIEKYNTQDNIKTRISNGLENVKREECSDIVIAGMGGELIGKIIEGIPWEIDNEINLILQPMTKVEKLREYLSRKNIEIITEEAVIAEHKIYTVIKCRYNKEMEKRISIKEKYIGKLNPKIKELDKMYVENIVKKLRKKSAGLEQAKREKERESVSKIINEIEKEYY